MRLDTLHNSRNAVLQGKDGTIGKGQTTMKVNTSYAEPYWLNGQDNKINERVSERASLFSNCYGLLTYVGNNFT